MIFIKSLFRGWIPATEEKALSFFKMKIKQLGINRHDTRMLRIINDRLKGIEFSFDDLK